MTRVASAQCLIKSTCLQIAKSANVFSIAQSANSQSPIVIRHWAIAKVTLMGGGWGTGRGVAKGTEVLRTNFFIF